MFRVASLALAAALAGVADAQTGCYARWGSSGNYQVDDIVSYAVNEQEQETVSCTVGTTGCSSGGTKTVVKTVTNYYNWKCHSMYYCDGYTPGGIYTAQAWTKMAECDKSLTTVTNPPPAAWAGAGCPQTYSAGGDYEAGDVVSVRLGDYTMVYQCKTGAVSAWCGNSGYDPGTSTYWSTSWDELGSCTGSISPTNSPSWDTIQDAGGCPLDWDGSTTYEEGDKVHAQRLVFQCKPYPQSGFCGNPAYEPLADLTTNYWKEAWEVVGHCSGTITPTTSPSFDVLEFVGGCPDEWETRTQDDPYKEGEKVSVGLIVYACNSWPNGQWCGQSGYMPGEDSTNEGTPEAWRAAWSVAGYCDGSMGPTGSPSFDPDNVIGACPDEWESRTTDNEYTEGDMVSVTVSETPIRKFAYKCKAWPYSGHCMTYSPEVFGGEMGWALVGPCDGSIGPTTSPSFDRLTEVGDGCPLVYSGSTEYKEGDKVAVTLSDAPVRKVVYECRSWPNTGYCNQEGFRPDDPNGRYISMGWNFLGFCDGTMAPTPAPSPYVWSCTYSKCNKGWYNDPCTPGSWGCSCPSGVTASSSCTKRVERCQYSTETVQKWSSGRTYEEGDVVRVNQQRYKCRNWPNSGWCSNSGYEPEVRDIYTNAWTKDGMCTTPAPTTSPTTASPTTSPTTASPTTSPTKNPTASPTKNPTASPTKNPTKNPTASPTVTP